MAQDNRALLESYRVKALFGGAGLGALLGALGAAPFLSSWPEPLKMYIIAIATVAGIGAIVGYFFYELVLADTAMGGSGGGYGGVGGSGGEKGESSGSEGEGSD